MSRGLGKRPDPQDGIPAGKGRWSFSDFSAPRLCRAMAVATAGEWEEAARTYGLRWIEELVKSGDPEVKARLLERLGIVSDSTDPVGAGLPAGLARKPEDGP